MKPSAVYRVRHHLPPHDLRLLAAIFGATPVPAQVEQRGSRRWGITIVGVPIFDTRRWRTRQDCERAIRRAYRKG